MYQIIQITVLLGCGGECGEVRPCMEAHHPYSDLGSSLSRHLVLYEVLLSCLFVCLSVCLCLSGLLLDTRSRPFVIDARLVKEL